MKLGHMLFWGVVFAISYTQAPLYYSNQNQYFVHGLAAAGHGDLRSDWLANTKDPTPIFSELVFVTARYLHEGFFYVYYFLILALYAYSMLGLFAVLAPAASSNVRLAFIALFLAAHAGIVRWASAQLFGVDYPWFLQAGVAGQYLLGFGLQPSVFGVLLIVSLVAFLRDHPWRAVFWACLAAVLHATYFPAAALLTLAYMVQQCRRRGWRHALGLGACALLLVAPALIYNVVTFAPTSAADFAEAQRILAHVRIPHHAEVERWLDPVAVAQLLWIVAALFLARRTRLFLLMLIPFLGSALVTLVQVVTGNDTLALLFPWRVTTLLVPLATTVILTAVVVELAARLPAVLAPAHGLSILIILGLFVGGLAVPYFGLGYRTNQDELPLLNYVREHGPPHAVYLLPVEVPKPWSGIRGVTSSNFLPAPRAGRAGGFIAIDLQQFRIATGKPIYVDFKSIPYQDVEVLEWERRLRWCARMYGDNGLSPTDLRAELTKEGITHVVALAGKPTNFTALGSPIYQDEYYRVFPIAKK